MAEQVPVSFGNWLATVVTVAQRMKHAFDAKDHTDSVFCVALLANLTKEESLAKAPPHVASIITRFYWDAEAQGMKDLAPPPYPTAAATRLAQDLHDCWWELQEKEEAKLREQ
jgi:hypothetical protein